MTFIAGDVVCHVDDAESEPAVILEVGERRGESYARLRWFTGPEAKTVDHEFVNFRTENLRPYTGESIIEAFAIEIAQRAHRPQKRKYTHEPYIVHSLEVAQLVRGVTHTPEMVAAGWLHDVVEDTSVTLGEVQVICGQAVADLVGMLTDVSVPADGNRAKRKAIDREHTACAYPEAKTVKLADLISNSRDICAHDPDFVRVYLREKALLMDVLKDGDAGLWKRAHGMLEATIEPAK